MIPSGIMFHHFHGFGNRETQGSISATELDELIQFVGRERILSAEDWLQRAHQKTLNPEDTCLTFDDSLKCQYDVALPVLEAHGLTAFWFVYTSIYTGQTDRLEIYRYFRDTFPNMDDFYDAFFSTVENSDWREMVNKSLQAFNPKLYLKDFPFYTDQDRKFRFVRDVALKTEPYYQVMDKMIAAKKFNLADITNSLWMAKDQLKDLAQKGHVIGLHSHSHPTRMGELSKIKQQEEFQENYRQIKLVTGQTPLAMSHPCNSYSEDTIEILKDLGIQIGFRANMAASKFGTQYEIPREDHANLITKMNIQLKREK